jgi:hypothetical protein
MPIKKPAVPGEGTPNLSCNRTTLDTLAQLPRSTSQVNHELNLNKLSKRARAKFLSDSVAKKLASLNSPLQKSYKSSLVCASVLTQVGADFTSMYCNQRWCIVCARNRTAILINGYVKQIEAMPQKYFVTLTAPNCDERFLQKTVKDYYRAINLISRKIRERDKVKFAGLRKFECTYNTDDDTYHPHYHLIINSANAAHLFKQYWLEHFPNAMSTYQVVKVADDDSVKELFKYFTKVVSKSKKQLSPVVCTAALDKIFRAIKGQRTFQPMGIKKVLDKLPKKQTFRLLDIRQNSATYRYIGSDWVDEKTQEALTNYRPSESLLSIVSNIY